MLVLLHDRDELLGVVGVPKLFIILVSVIIIETWEDMHRKHELFWGRRLTVLLQDRLKPIELNFGFLKLANVFLVEIHSVQCD